MITLSDWVFNAIKHNEVLTLHRDYFRLRKPIERRIYELARKHCGQQPSWKASVEILHRKSGSKSSEKEFRRAIRNLAASDHLPDYIVSFDTETDMVLFHNRSTMKITGQAAELEPWDGFLHSEFMLPSERPLRDGMFIIWNRNGGPGSDVRKFSQNILKNIF